MMAMILSLYGANEHKNKKGYPFQKIGIAFCDSM